MQSVRHECYLLSIIKCVLSKKQKREVSARVVHVYVSIIIIHNVYSDNKYLI